MKRTVLMRAGLMSVFWLFVLPTGAEAASTPLSVRDRAIIGEVNNLWASVADSIWPGAAAVNIPFLFVGDHYEYAIGFPTSLEGFNDSGDSLLRGRVQVRKRTLDRDLSASFPFQGFPAVVIGSPEGVSKSVSEWVITAGHEMFHVFQAAKGSYKKTAALEIGPPNEPGWQLTFPFPYAESDVMQLIHLQGYLSWLAYMNTEADEAKYAIGTALDAAQLYRSRLARGRTDAF